MASMDVCINSSKTSSISDAVTISSGCGCSSPSSPTSREGNLSSSKASDISMLCSAIESQNASPSSAIQASNQLLRGGKAILPHIPMWQQRLYLPSSFHPAEEDTPFRYVLSYQPPKTYLAHPVYISNILYPLFNVISKFFVADINVASFHASGHQGAIGVLDDGTHFDFVFFQFSFFQHIHTPNTMVCRSPF